MNWILNNWYILLAVVAILGAAGFAAYRFLGLSRETQLAKVRKWLLWAVTRAEQELGGGTGRLKLRQVYDLFVVRFPWLVRAVSFELFSDMVDDALDEMRKMLENNQAVKTLVEGGNDNGNTADA